MLCNVGAGSMVGAACVHVRVCGERKSLEGVRVTIAIPVHGKLAASPPSKAAPTATIWSFFSSPALNVGWLRTMVTT